MFKGKGSQKKNAANKSSCKSSKVVGAEVEQFVKKFLLGKKLEFITQNFYSRFGEIDLVFIDNATNKTSSLGSGISVCQKTLVFVEVKYRINNKHGSGLESVNHAKQQKLIKTAHIYLQKHKKFSQLASRFDVVSVTLKNDQLVADWYPSAFLASAW